MERRLMTRTRNKKPTIAEIRASLANKPEYLKDLESCPVQPLKPEALVKWVREVFRVGRSTNVSDKDLVWCIQVYARKGYYTDKQIAAVLDDFV
jgi:hypothetical protein